MSCWSVYGQQFSFTVETVGFEPTEALVLKKYHGVEEVPIDTIRGSGKFTFNISTENGVNGLYLISASRSEIAELVTNSSENQLSILVDKDGLKEGRITISNSPENVAYGRFVNAYLGYEQDFYRLASKSFDSFDKKIISSISEQTESMESVQRIFNEELTRIATDFPSTYTATILCPLARRPLRDERQKETFETYTSFLNQHFWDSSNLSEPMVLNHFLLNESLKNYFRFFVPKREEDIKGAIDIIHLQSGVNEKVNAHVRSFMLRNFLNANANALSAYVNQLSDDGACSLNLSEGQLEKLKNLTAPIDSGSVVPEVILQNRDQKEVSLSSIYRKSKITLVLFWSANCVHCTEEMPVLVDAYGKFKRLGLEVYSINLDENKFDWRDFLDQNQTTWINVSDVGAVRTSEIVRMFNIQKTPGLFLVNSDGLVVGKNLFGGALDDFLQAYLESK